MVALSGPRGATTCTVGSEVGLSVALSSAPSRLATSDLVDSWAARGAGAGPDSSGGVPAQSSLRSQRRRRTAAARSSALRADEGCEKKLPSASLGPNSAAGLPARARSVAARQAAELDSSGRRWHAGTAASAGAASRCRLRCRWPAAGRLRGSSLLPLLLGARHQGLRRVGLAAVDIDDQAIGIGQQKGRVVGDIIDLKHHPHHALLKLRDAHPAQKSVGDLEGFADQGGSQLGVMQVKENPVGIGDAPASYFTSCSRSMATRV